MAQPELAGQHTIVLEPQPSLDATPSAIRLDAGDREPACVEDDARRPPIARDPIGREPCRIDGEIERQRPDDAILAEEGGGLDREGTRWRWIIDPLDGTTNYAHGFPRFCVSIGVELEGEREVAVVYDPLLDEAFHAVRGHGAWLGSRRLEVSPEPDLGNALIATGFAYDVRKSRDDNVAEFARMLKGARGLRRDGSAALDLSYVASGRLDAYWEQKLSPWDVAAGILLVQEAGGRVTDMQGGPAPSSGRQIVASNAALHDEILRRLDR